MLPINASWNKPEEGKELFKLQDNIDPRKNEYKLTMTDLGVERKFLTSKGASFEEEQLEQKS